MTITESQISDLSHFSGNYNDLTNRPTLFSGSYNDLTNKPTIPTNNNQLTNGAGYTTNTGDVGNTYLTSQLSSKLDSSSYTASDVLTKIKTVDGPSSGLDADTLDGQQLSALVSNNYVKAEFTSNTYIQDYVTTEINNLVASAPGTLDTLNELAAALGDDPNFSTTITNMVGTRATNTYVNSTFSSNVYITAQLSDKLDSSTYTASDVLTKIKTVDGASSGLDADTLDGQQLSALASNNYLQGLGYITDYTVTQSDVTAHQAALSITESQISDLAHFSGSYNDLTNKPTLFSGSYTDLTNKPSLFSGSYDDLTNKPTIPTNNNQLTNGAGYITGYTVSESDVTGHQAALSITESQISDLQTYLTAVPAEYLTQTEGDARYLQSYTVTQGDVTAHQGALSITESQISDLSHFSGSYTDLTNKPTIPTNNNQLTNGAGYITGYTVTQSDVTSHQAALTLTASQIPNISAAKLTSGTLPDARISSTFVSNAYFSDNSGGGGDSANALVVDTVEFTNSTSTTQTIDDVNYVHHEAYFNGLLLNGSSYSISSNTITLSGITPTTSDILTVKQFTGSQIQTPSGVTSSDFTTTLLIKNSSGTTLKTIKSIS